VSKQKVGTKEFAEAVAQRLGQEPQLLKAARYKQTEPETAVKRSAAPSARSNKELVGVDVFLDWSKGSANDLGNAVSKLNGENLRLTMMSNRGVKVWPGGYAETFCSDHWRCRFLSQNSKPSHHDIVLLLERVFASGLDFIKTENLYNFDGQKGYSLDQGE
jgi:isocitrate dehydrogenase